MLPRPRLGQLDAPTYPTPWRAAGILAGGFALVGELALPGAVRAVPVGPLWINALLLLGLLSLFLFLFEGRERALGDRLFVALVPYLAAGVLTRLLYSDPGTSQTVVLEQAAVPEVVALVLGLGLAWVALSDKGASSGRGLVPVTVLGTSAAFVLLGWHIAGAMPVTPGVGTVLGLTATGVVACLLVQRWIARRGEATRVRSLASAPALAVAGGQLLDGIVSYLAVVDPLGLLATNAAEGVLLSRALLTTVGPVFPLAKWFLALGAVALVEPVGAEQKAEPWWPRFTVLVLVLFAGLGPGLFSSLQVLTG